MFFRLALGNVRKSARDYTVYFVTLVLGVAVFYAFSTISDQASFLSTDTREAIQVVGGLMRIVTVFLAFVLGFLMVYANNYLVKRRKREFGLYQLLGMTRGQVSAVLFLETTIASVASFLIGLLVGILLSWLLVFVTAALFGDQVTNFTFQFSSAAAAFTLGCFVIIFLVMLAFNLRMLRKVDLADLMGASRKNEQVKVRSLPVTFLFGLAGIALIAWAYYRLTRDGLPFSSMDDYGNFCATTGIVCLGTLVFFYGLSGIPFHVGRAFHGAYYRGLNMFTVRQLSSKVNTVSASMAVISFILFLAIMAVSGGMGICSGLDADIKTSNPYDASLVFSYTEDGVDDTQRIVPANQVLENAGIDFSSIASQLAYVNVYYSDLVGGGSLNVQALSEASGVSLDVIEDPSDSADYSSMSMYLMTQSDYNKIRALNGLSSMQLGEDGYLILSSYTALMKSFDDKVMAAGTQIAVSGRTLSPVSSPAGSDLSSTISNVADRFDIIVVPDDLVEGAELASTVVDMNYSVSTEAGDAYFSRATSDLFDQANPDGALSGFSYGLRSENTQTTRMSSAIVSYLAIYIGFVLVIACAAILAIQQLSSVSDAISSYRLLTDLGCPKSMATRSLFAQTLAFFLLPLVVALMHTSVALRQLIRVVSLVGSSNWTGAIVTTAIAFVAVYGTYFVITFLTARGILTMHASRARE